MKNYDLHVHSHYSDGSYSPEEIMKRAHQRGLYKIALTDHDTIIGIKHAQVAAQRYGLKFVPGMELSVAFNENRMLHILGLGLDVDRPEFLARYENYRENRQAGVRICIKKLQEKGIPITFVQVKAYGNDEPLDRQAVSKWLVATGIAKNTVSSWIDFLDDIPYAEHELLSPQEAFDMIHAGGGKAYLAHLHKYIGFAGYSKDQIFHYMKQLHGIGLDGVEAFYPNFSEDDHQLIDELIETYGLLVSGGSDYHGSNRPEVDLGVLGFLHPDDSRCKLLV